MINKLRELFSKKKYKLTPKGECFFNYLKNLKDGKEDYVEEYEESISETMKVCSMTRERAIDTLILTLIKQCDC